MDIFEVTSRPDESLFFSSYDPNDPRLGSIVKSAPADYDFCRYVLLGSPQDLGVARNRGRVGAAQAPDTIRKVLYKMAHPKELEELGFFDIGNLKTDEDLEIIHDTQTEVVEQLLHDNKVPIVLGGGNDVSYPDAKAVKSVFGSLAAINIDNHFDVRLNDNRNSGTPYRMLLEEGHVLPEKFVELGCQKPANSHIYRQYLKELGVRIYYFDEVQSTGIRTILPEIMDAFGNTPLFWGYDMDSVRASDAPGVSAITPIGLSGAQAVEIAKFAGTQPMTKLFEISEVNPAYDIDDRTVRLAALMVIHFVSSHLFTFEV